MEVRWHLEPRKSAPIERGFGGRRAALPPRERKTAAAAHRRESGSSSPAKSKAALRPRKRPRPFLRSAVLIRLSLPCQVASDGLRQPLTASDQRPLPHAEWMSASQPNDEWKERRRNGVSVVSRYVICGSGIGWRLHPVSGPAVTSDSGPTGTTSRVLQNL